VSGDLHAAPDRARALLRVTRLDGGSPAERDDRVVVEEPLEIRLAIGDAPVEPLLLTMRTPGRPTDFELAVGLLWAEGVVRSPEQVLHVGYCLDPDLSAEQHFNVVTVTLSGDVTLDRVRLSRSLAVTSACGVCGKTTLDQLAIVGHEALDPAGGPRIAASVLYALPERLRNVQGIFADTGGLHAAGLFDSEGRLLAAREDVGRHNAVDKIVGWALGQGRLPLEDGVLLVSGRAGFEILQKALAAGIPIVASVSAPSSLAVSLAERFGLTLIGFLRGERANVYAGAQRLTGLDRAETIG
jgi:FdhD protein